ncbi:carboxylesterase/lipase family protein [Pseudomonas sp. NPDC089392]|uniref:carboxylesterase/lipase family protein n=1 Tax=Pseudomonas sp. NPDC089392 TaxID=3364459 RepID=UPI00381F873F
MKAAVTELFGIRKTDSGYLQGARDGEILSWLGVPYAQAERFGPPQPVTPWEGTRPAINFAAQCPQRRGSEAKRAQVESPDYGENCLNLNIWAPVGKSSELKPVMVWIHGGAFLIGGSNPYNGAELAALGDMLVVTLNYRLGILGFANFAEAFDLPEIPSNLGLRDQIAALEWIRDNIQAFGGDPTRVTVAGESAGSVSVSLLMLSSKAWPLFHGAIMQSGAVNLIQDREKSRGIGRRYAKLLGLETVTIDTLRQVSLEQLLEAQAAINSQELYALPASPWFDGDLLPGSLAEAHAAPTAPVPLLAGANLDEARRFEIFPGNKLVPVRWLDMEKLLRSQLPSDQVERILASYPRTREGQSALASDLNFILPTRHFAERHSAVNPTWFYRFDYRHPLLGACHALELAFLWPVRGIFGFLIRGGPMCGARGALGNSMKANWAHFVRSGCPLPGWPQYTTNTPNVRIFDLRESVISAPEPERYTAWAGRDVMTGLWESMQLTTERHKHCSPHDKLIN